MRIPVAKEALKLSVPLMILSVILVKVSLILSVLCLIFLVSTLLFFRDPARVAPQDSRYILSPCDGRVIQIRELQEEGDHWTLVSIFMSPFNVHINYAPISGKIQKVEHRKGKFLKAYHQDAPTQNESNTIVIQGSPIKVKMIQIAGTLARRIVCYSKPGDVVKPGQKVGLIQFGSRVDIYFPTSVKIKIENNEVVRGAQTLLGEILRRP